ncbi:MAG: 50S ribosomal protein L21 [bacterium]|nr:50S ribosomal protein L21 [bacterium]
MQHAIIKTGGKQYIVAPGETHTFEKLPGDAGSSVSFDEVLCTFDDVGAVTIGAPIVGIAVVGTVVEQGRARKIVGLKYKAKSRYRRHYGHRQYQTKVKIETIGTKA